MVWREAQVVVSSRMSCATKKHVSGSMKPGSTTTPRRRSSLRSCRCPALCRMLLMLKNWSKTVNSPVPSGNSTPIATAAPQRSAEITTLPSPAPKSTKLAPAVTCRAVKTRRRLHAKSSFVRSLRPKQKTVYLFFASCMRERE
jgi:hypothetical protein